VGINDRPSSGRGDNRERDGLRKDEIKFSLRVQKSKRAIIGRVRSARRGKDNSLHTRGESSRARSTSESLFMQVRIPQVGFTTFAQEENL
jgi:hypothetical protein